MLIQSKRLYNYFFPRLCFSSCFPAFSFLQQFPWASNVSAPQLGQRYFLKLFKLLWKGLLLSSSFVENFLALLEDSDHEAACSQLNIKLLASLSTLISIEHDHVEELDSFLSIIMMYPEVNGVVSLFFLYLDSRSLICSFQLVCHLQINNISKLAFMLT